MLQAASHQKPGWEGKQILLRQYRARNKLKIKNKLQINK